jgi:hypothetical protein
MIRIEEALGCWEQNAYGIESLYPNQYRQPKKVPSHFTSLYWGLFVLCGVILALVWIPYGNGAKATPGNDIKVMFEDCHDGGASVMGKHSGQGANLKK